MTTIIRLLPLAVIACLAWGCSDSSSFDGAQGNSAPSDDAPAVGDVAAQFTAQRPAKTYDDPSATVRDFLTAVCSGDDQTATSLLSTAAQEEAWKNGMAISADGFPQAKFDVSQVEHIDETEAHVMSVWSDVTPDGQTKTFQCVWLLSREQHGWCVYGMATKFLESMSPVILNFENHADMTKKQRWVEKQIAQHRQHQQTQSQEQGARPAIQQATRPTAEAAR